MGFFLIVRGAAGGMLPPVMGGLGLLCQVRTRGFTWGSVWVEAQGGASGFWRGELLMERLLSLGPPLCLERTLLMTRPCAFSLLAAGRPL